MAATVLRFQMENKRNIMAIYYLPGVLNLGVVSRASGALEADELFR
jgi:hypothetical protein